MFWVFCHGKEYSSGVAPIMSDIFTVMVMVINIAYTRFVEG